MWLVLALLAVDGLAAEVEIEVRGLGQVPLTDATETCLQGRPVGALDEPKSDRTPAFREVVRGVMRLSPDDRKVWTGLDEAWPSIPADIDYAPQVPMAQPWVTQACLAVGRYWVDVGLELAGPCPDDKKGCRAAFTDDELVIIKEAQKAARKNKDETTDAFFSVVRGFDDALVTWRDPEPFLIRACDRPSTAADGGRFVDTDDLVAARRACLQQLALLRRGLPDTLEALECDTVWRDTTADQPHLGMSPTTDLGMADDIRDIKIDGLLDRLTRMDPGAATCELPWASVWRDDLTRRWREAQAERACVDPDLTMTDRKRLCPDLVPVLKSRCDRDDGPACYTLSRMMLVGLGVEMDERAAIEMLARACNVGHEPSCNDLGSFAPMVTGWVDELRTVPAPEEGDEPVDEPAAARDARLNEALTLVVQYQLGLGDAWAASEARSLFDAAIEQEAAAVAESVLEQFEPVLDEEWRKKAEKKL